MSERPLCPECAMGRHSRCSGDFSRVSVFTCWCRTCKDYLDEHGFFAAVPDVREITDG
jgi:hypothetical protein